MEESFDRTRLHRSGVKILENSLMAMEHLLAQESSLEFARPMEQRVRNGIHKRTISAAGHERRIRRHGRCSTLADEICDDSTMVLEGDLLSPAVALDEQSEYCKARLTISQSNT